MPVGESLGTQYTFLPVRWLEGMGYPSASNNQPQHQRTGFDLAAAAVVVVVVVVAAVAAAAAAA